ncbi:MAG: TauD/TfdA family dioxygenase [Pseudomonadota bacterium]
MGDPATTSDAPFEVVPTGAAVGAEIRGLDVRTLDDATFLALRQEWLTHKVLLFRGQSMTDDDLVAFAKRFGPLDLAPASATDNVGSQEKSRPDIWIISNVVEDGKPIGALGSDEAEWHTDMSYVDEPPMASVLYSLEIPPSGGDTSFANMVTALEALPDDLRAKIEGRVANHDSSYTSVGELRVGAEPVTDVTKAPGARHPIIRTHPESGEKALYLGRRSNGWIVDMDSAENEALLDALWAHCADPRFSWTHQWRTGDLLIWDNRSLNHKREAFDPMSRRVMHRCQIKGDTPR